MGGVSPRTPNTVVKNTLNGCKKHKLEIILEEYTYGGISRNYYMRRQT